MMEVLIRSTTRNALPRSDEAFSQVDTIFGQLHIVTVRKFRDVIVVVLQDGYIAKRDTQDNLWIEE